jgi:heat-inducible transcriptional repressor
MKRQSRSDELVSERAQQLFKLLVERYLLDGAPVPSKFIAMHPGVDVSAATVRNVMADLEARGFLSSPHTSAGKVPTHHGLRFFVETLLSFQPLDDIAVSQIGKELNPDLSTTELVESASSMLAQITKMAGVVTLPRREEIALRQVEFLPLTGTRVLAILVFNEREVQNRVIHTQREYNESELTQAANYLNREFGGRSLFSVRGALLDSMQQDKDRMDQLMQTALDVATKAFEATDSGQRSYVVTGEANLIEHDRNAETVRQLFEAFSRKRDLLHLLDRCLQSDGVQLFIGRESGYAVLGDYSLVTAPYEVKGRVAGVLGVIGPTRMAYQRVIPIVDVTAKMLGAAMTHS